MKGAYDYNTNLDAARKPEGIKAGPDYYFERYSKDPDLAASQQLEQQQLLDETGERTAYSRSNFKPPRNQLQTKDDDAAKTLTHLQHRKKAGDMEVSYKKNN